MKKNVRVFAHSLVLLLVAGVLLADTAQSQIRILVVDGVNNHDWQAGTTGIRIHTW
jgi:hypothetical protein